MALGKTIKPRVSVEHAVETEPTVWFRANGDGSVSYGVSAKGRSLTRAATNAMATFTRVKHYVEVEVPGQTDDNRKELLEASALRAATKATS